MLYSFDNQQLDRLNNLRRAIGEPTDAQLLAEIAEGSEAALTTLTERHTPLLRTVISRVLSDVPDADEVLQDALTDIWNHAAHYSPEKGHAIGWIATVARRRAIDRLRRKLTYCRARDRYEEHVKIETEECEAHSVESNASMGELKEIFCRMIDELPSGQREALNLTVYGGLSQRQIAARTGTPLGTIKTRLELAMRKVRNALLAKGTREEWMGALVGA
jgi:RNA polymerase sigma-70 factor, ECF subfamily